MYCWKYSRTSESLVLVCSPPTKIFFKVSEFPGCCCCCWGCCCCFRRDSKLTWKPTRVDAYRMTFHGSRLWVNLQFTCQRPVTTYTNPNKTHFLLIDNMNLFRQHSLDCFRIDEGNKPKTPRSDSNTGQG